MAVGKESDHKKSWDQGQIALKFTKRVKTMNSASTSMVSSVVRETLVIWHDHPDKRLWSLVLRTVVNHCSPYRFGHSVQQLQSEGGGVDYVCRLTLQNVTTPSTML